MKYILIILICFIGIAGYSQPVNKQPRSNFPTVVDSSLAIGKNFILPVFRSFSQLATYTNLDSSGRLVFIRDSNAVFYRTNAHTWAKLSTGSGSGSVAWGSITGTLSNQTDLQTVLDSKVDSVILRGGDSLYNHYATGEVQFIGVFSTNTPNLLDGLISVQDITLVDTTVTIVPDIVYRRNNVNDTQSVGVVFEVNKADSGYSRFDLIYIDSLNVIRLIEGVQDTGVIVPPAMPPHGIQVTIVSIVGDVVQQPVPSIITNYWSPNGNNISSGTAYLGTLNSKSLDFMTGGTVKATLDTIGQLRFPLLNNGNYPHALTFYNNADATVPSFNLAVNSSYGEITLRPTNSGFVNGFRMKKSADADSLVGSAYSNMYLQDYGKLKYNTTSSQTSAFEVTQANTPLFTVNSTTKPGAYFGSDTTYKPSSALTVSSTTQGILVPRMTTTQMNAIGTPSNGLLIYNLDSTAFYYYQLSAWTKIATGSGSSTQDTLFVKTPLSVTNDTLSMKQLSAFDSGWVSPDQAFVWDQAAIDVQSSIKTIVAITDTSFENTHIDGSKDTTVLRGSGGGSVPSLQQVTNVNYKTATGLWASYGVFGDTSEILNASRTNIIAGEAVSSGAITNDLGIGNIAAGRATGTNSEVYADDVGGIAIGVSQSGGKIKSTGGAGAIAIGQSSSNGVIQADDAGSLAIGLAGNDSLFTTGASSIVAGQNNVNEAPQSFLFGSGLRNYGFTDAERAFRVGWDANERFTILENGNVGIGTTTPDSAKLVVKGGIITDSIRIGNDWFYTKKITLTPADVYTLNSVPVLAIDAPGAGKAIEIISASARLLYNTTPYDTDATLVLKSVNTITQITSLSFLSTTTVGTQFQIGSYSDSFNENAPISITSDQDNSTGDSDLNIYIHYRVVNL